MNRKVVLTCEHAGNVVPEEYRYLFNGHEEVLTTHRGYDIGALELAETISRILDVKLSAHLVTRLLVDLNRSLDNPTAFSEFTKKLEKDQKQKLIRDIYDGHRSKVEEDILSFIQHGYQVLHLGIHTFTPELQGVVRHADVGLLFDPGRCREKTFCEAWRQELQSRLPSLRIRMNYPYRGTMDGFSTLLRNEYEERHYIGVELEVNQKFSRDGSLDRWVEVQEQIALSFESVNKQLKELA